MKKLWVCCAAALCAVLAGCATNRQEPREPDPPVVQQAAPEEKTIIPDEGPAAPPQEEKREEPAAPEDAAPGDPYAGAWRDPKAPECRMEIGLGDDGVYSIEVTRTDSPQESTVWLLTGTYDEIWEGIDYIGAKYTETADAGGAVQRTMVPDREEITGLIFFRDGGPLQWEEIFDHAGDNLMFERE